MSKDNRKRRQEAGLLPAPQTCSAKSKRTGNPCGNAPLAGAVVCRMHGGSAPQVLRKAQERLALAADDAVSVLVRLMADETVSASDRRQIATAILDRAGISTRAELAVTVQQPWEAALEGMVFDGVVAELPGGAVPTRGDATTYSGRPTPGPPEDVVDAVVVPDA